MKYRRVLVPGGIIFFTVITHNRMPTFGDEEAVRLLRQAIREVLLRHPFKIQAAVILPDHLHMIWQLPEEDWDYPTRWRLIKSHFTRNWRGKLNFPKSGSRIRKGEGIIWQRRYWEHLIRDETDWQRHVDYIHYNPVKHGLVSTPGEWSVSSFHSLVSQGFYPDDWGADKNMKIDLDLD